MGSGKSGTPLSRMHWANLRARLDLLGTEGAGHEPRWLQVLTRADGLLNAAVLGSSDEPALIPMVNSPDAPGSGNSLTPLLRMHSANFTAFS